MSRDRKNIYLKISGLFLVGAEGMVLREGGGVFGLMVGDGGGGWGGFWGRGGRGEDEGGLIFLSRDSLGVGGLVVNGGNKGSEGLVEGRGLGDKGGLDNGCLIIGEGGIGLVNLGGGLGEGDIGGGGGGGGGGGASVFDEYLFKTD